MPPFALPAVKWFGKPFGRFLVLALVAAMLAPSAFADRVSEMMRLHTEAIGGKARIAGLKSMRATGHVITGDKRVKFTMIAARPDMVRLETEAGSRTLVQGTDGRDAPWEFDTGEWPPRYRDMAQKAAAVFKADAEFDDPLVAGAARGYTIEYGGEVDIDGRKCPRLLVSRKLSEVFSLILDPRTLLIIQRVEERKDKLGMPARVVAKYEEHRPVGGVLIPHSITVMIGDRVIQQTKINVLEANPKTEADTFSRPRAIRSPKR